jgi:hypothetical protein
VTNVSDTKMNGHTLSTPYLLLSLADHQSTPLESDRHGGPQTRYARCLNVAGRWAVHGSPYSPLLVWHSTQAVEAHAAAERSAKARGRSVKVLTRSDSSWEEGREIQVFSEAFEPALLGYTAQTEAKVRRLRTEADKLEAFCLVVREASTAANHEEFVKVSRAAGKALHAKFGGGSIASASAWLAGRKGREALQSVLSGEVEVTGPLSIEQIVETVTLAAEAERLREEAETPN